MKRLYLLLVVLSSICLLATGDLSARGGGGSRGGGGVSRGGGGGSYSRPSPSISRSPSVSRPSPSISRPSTPSVSRPSTPSVSRPSTGTRPSTGGLPSAGTRPSTGGLPSAGTRPSTGARPSQGDLQNFLNVKPSTGAIGGAGAATRPGGSNLGAAVAGGAAGGAAAAFLQNGGAAERPSAGQLPAGGNRADIAGDRANVAGARTDRVEARTDVRSDRQANRPERIENRQELASDRSARRDEIVGHCHNHPIRDFWSEYPGWAALRITRPYRWATWGAITGWVGYGWSDPVYYNYGDTVYYEGDSVYYGDQVVATTQQYTEQAEAIAAAAPEELPADGEWMPLGVFALTQDGEASGADPTLFLQLAISKEGIISGTFSDTAADKTQTIEGMADQKTQRCAWTVVGQTRPIMETGINNLTENTAPALVHFADGQTQQWLMVRLDDPSAQQ